MTHLIGLIKGATALAIFIAISWYVLARLRRPHVAPQESISGTLRRYEEAYRNGDLSLEEYKAIRATLATALKTSMDEETSSAVFLEAGTSDSAEKRAKLLELLEAERR